MDTTLCPLCTKGETVEHLFGEWPMFEFVFDTPPKALGYPSFLRRCTHLRNVVLLRDTRFGIFQLMGGAASPCTLQMTELFSIGRNGSNNRFM